MTARKRVRAADDPHRAEPRVARTRRIVDMTLARETVAALDAHAERLAQPRSRVAERFILEGLAREREA